MTDTYDINQATIDLVKRWEGFEGRAYRCPGGRWTIGYGHTSQAGTPAVKPGMTVTHQEAENILRKDLKMFADGVHKLIKVDLNDNQFGALVSFAYNVGVGGFARSSVLKAVNSGDFDAVPRRLSMWNKAGGKVLLGLVRRRADEAALFFQPVKEQGTGVPSVPGGQVEIDIPAGKPLGRSTTVWSALGGGLLTAFTSVVSLGESQPLLAGAIILTAGGFAWWIIRERRLKALDEAV